MDDLQMQMIFKRDLSAPLLVQTSVTLLKQGDSEANALVIDLYNGSEETDASGYTVSGYLLRADGVRVPLEGNVNGRRVTVGLNKHCYLVPGPYGAFVRLTKGEFKRTILEIAGLIESEGSGPVVDTGEKFITIEEIIEQMDAMKQVTEETSKAAENANAATADANNAAESANGAAENANKWANAEANATSVPAGDQPTVSVTEVNGKKVISFGIPAGITPSITFNVATGEPGTQVEVSQSGTPEAPVVNLTIPRGDTGAVDGIDYYSGTPSALGEGSPGTSNEVARGDHMHPIPSASDVGALPADGTAENASKLGGKAPSYYGRPKNLLGNSNWRNPVNQRGITGPTESAGFHLDRWVNTYIRPKVTVNAGYVTLTNDSSNRYRVFQRLTAGTLVAGTKYTAAIKLHNGGVYCAAITAASGDQYSSQVENIFRFCITKGDTYDSFSISIVAGKTLDVEWVALYEGDYTADLPPYAPRGYATELLECQRYFIAFPTYSNYVLPFAHGTATGETTARVELALPVPMRIETPSMTSDSVTWYLRSAGTSEIATVSVLKALGNKLVLTATVASGLTTHQQVTLSYYGASGKTLYTCFSAEIGEEG